MRRSIHFLCLGMSVSISASAVEWNDLSVLHQNREAPRATMMVYADERKRSHMIERNHAGLLR